MITFRPLPGPGPVDDATIAAVVRVFREARRERLQFLLDLHDADEDRHFLRDAVFPTNDVWVADADAHVGGFVAFANGWVNHLYVAPALQRQGIGAALLALAKARHRSLELWAFKANEPAIRFYERHGFRVIERTDGSSTEAKQPDVRMRWEAGPGANAMK